MKVVFRLYPYVNFKNEKAFRLLDMYERFMKGEILNKLNLSYSYSVSEKTVQRDISDLRSYLAETRLNKDENTICYDKKCNGYYMKHDESLYLNHAEIISLCKLIIYTKAFSQNDCEAMVKKLISMSAMSCRREIEETLKRELNAYQKEMTRYQRVEKIGYLSEVMINHKWIEITYDQNHQCRKERIQPNQLFFYHHQFVLLAYSQNEKQSLLYYVDWILEMKDMTNEYLNYYQNEFRNVSYMLVKRQFYINESELEDTMKKHPTASIIEQGKQFLISVMIYQEKDVAF